MHVLYTLLLMLSLLASSSCLVHRKKPWVYGVPNPTLLMLIGGIDSDEQVLDEVMVIKPDGSICNFTDDNKILLEFPLFQAAATTVNQGVLICGGYNSKFIWQSGCQFWRPRTNRFFILNNVTAPFNSKLKRRSKGRVAKLEPHGRGQQRPVLDEERRQTMRLEEKRMVKKKFPKVPMKMPPRIPNLLSTQQAANDSLETSPYSDLSWSMSKSQAQSGSVKTSFASKEHSASNKVDDGPNPTTSSTKKLLTASSKAHHLPGEGDLEYSSWTGHVGSRWKSLSVTTLMISFESEDLMAIPYESSEFRDSFWYLHSFGQVNSFFSARISADLSSISWVPKATPDLMGHYPDSVGACPIIFGGQLLMIGSTNEQNKGVLIFRDGETYEKKILRFHEEDLGVNASFGNWSDFAVMSTGLPGEARDYFGCAIFFDKPVFSGGLTYQMDKFIMADHHYFSVHFKKWDAKFKILSMKIPRFKHILAVLSDGRTEHLLNVFGFSRGGLLTNTIERYIHSENPSWVLYENVRPAGPMARYAHVVIPSEWVPQCHVDKVVEHETNGGNERAMLYLTNLVIVLFNTMLI